MTVESSTQAICDLALRFGEGEEETMVRIVFFFGGGLRNYRLSFII